MLASTAHGQTDPIEQMYARVGLALSYPPTHLRINSRYGIDITPDEQRVWQQLRGQALRDIADDLANDQDFNSLPIARQRQILQRATTRADDVARREFLSQLPDSDLDERAMPSQGRGSAGPEPFASTVPSAVGAGVSAASLPPSSTTQATSDAETPTSTFDVQVPPAPDTITAGSNAALRLTNMEKAVYEDAARQCVKDALRRGDPGTSLGRLASTLAIQRGAQEAGEQAVVQQVNPGELSKCLAAGA